MTFESDAIYRKYGINGVINGIVSTVIGTSVLSAVHENLGGI